MTISARERVLAGVVAGVVFILLNMVIVRAFAAKQALLRKQIAVREQQVNVMQTLLAERDTWAQRDAWITAKQEKLTNENSAGVQLLELIERQAKQRKVTVENQVLASVASTPWYRSVAVTLETKSSWTSLVQFLHVLQQPEQFVVFESASIKIDPADHTQMRGTFRIARWFAP